MDPPGPGPGPKFGPGPEPELRAPCRQQGLCRVQAPGLCVFAPLTPPRWCGFGTLMRVSGQCLYMYVYREELSINKAVGPVPAHLVCRPRWPIAADVRLRGSRHQRCQQCHFARHLSCFQSWFVGMVCCRIASQLRKHATRYPMSLSWAALRPSAAKQRQVHRLCAVQVAAK